MRGVRAGGALALGDLEDPADEVDLRELAVRVARQDDELLLDRRGRLALAGFIQALAGQTRRYGIRANAVTPGAHASRTELTAIWPENTSAPVTEAIALRRFASAAEAADRVAFLLSDAAADLTGTVVEVPGGISLPEPA